MARDRNYRMGKLHDEWNDLLMSHQLLNIVAPRDHLKTFFFSEAYPLQAAKFNAGIRIQIFRKSDGLGVETLDKIKKWAEAPYFADLLSGADLYNKTQLRFGNGTEIYTSGFWSAVRGGHPDIIILDDIIDTDVIYSDEQNTKARERLAAEILPMAEPHTKIVIIGTIQREDDIYSINWGEVTGGKMASRTYDAITDEEKHTTLFPEKWSWDALMAKKETIKEVSGVGFFNKEYRNWPIRAGGAIIKPEWLRTYEKLPANLSIYTGWDLATGKDLESGDWTAKATIGVDTLGNIYLIDIWRARIDFGQRVRKLIEFGQAENPKKIKVESNAFQNDTVQTAKKNCSLPIEGVKTTKNKIQKFREDFAPICENGKFYIKAGDKNQEEFWEEALALPRGKHDDRVDAVCIAIKDLPLLTKASDYIITV